MSQIYTYRNNEVDLCQHSHFCSLHLFEWNLMYKHCRDILDNDFSDPSCAQLLILQSNLQDMYEYKTMWVVSWTAYCVWCNRRKYFYMLIGLYLYYWHWFTYRLQSNVCIVHCFYIVTNDDVILTLNSYKFVFSTTSNDTTLWMLFLLHELHMFICGIAIMSVFIRRINALT